MMTKLGYTACALALTGVSTYWTARLSDQLESTQAESASRLTEILNYDKQLHDLSDDYQIAAHALVSTKRRLTECTDYTTRINNAIDKMH